MSPKPNAKAETKPASDPAAEIAALKARLAAMEGPKTETGSTVGVPVTVAKSQPVIVAFKLVLDNGKEIPVGTSLGLSGNGKLNFNGNGKARLGDHEWQVSLNVTLPTKKGGKEIPFPVYAAAAAAYGLKIKQDSDTGEVTLA
jgi:hypothetical protein